jgi:two-component sensor histidine kinase
MLDISSTSTDDEIVIVWSETGGPAIAGAPERHGFGSRILRSSVERQLRGELDLDWQETGLVATLRVPRRQLAD